MTWTGPNDAPLSTKEERMALYTATSTQEWKAPGPVGYIVVADGLTVAVYKKPNVFHMLMMHLFFGWDYKPIEGEQ